MNKNHSNEKALGEAVEALLERAAVLVRDHAADLESVLSASDIELMPHDRAQAFYERILLLIREHEARTLDDEARQQLVERVRQEASAIMPARTIELVGRYGVEPHDVRPTPTFNGIPVEMEEGYVDIEVLHLWGENPRSELHTEDFYERFNRAPDEAELFKVLTGQLHLPGAQKKDPFELRKLARSISRKGVQQPIVTKADGTILDGNRRWTASMLVLDGRDYSPDEKERAQWVRVRRLHPDATDDQVEAVVVALNFEEDLKEPWPEYVKARRVVQTYDALCQRKNIRLTASTAKSIREEVAKQFAIGADEVARYIKMVRWADDFVDYSVNEAGRDTAKVRHRTNKIFQWFYELEAGKKGEKLTEAIQAEDRIRSVVYDLMFNVLDSGAQVRALYKVLADPAAYKKLLEAHQLADVGDDDPEAEERREDALDVVNQAITDAQDRRKRRARAKAGFDEFLRTAVDKFGQASSDDWQKIETELMKDALRVTLAAVGSAQGVLAARGELSEDHAPS